ncbi:MazG nucleotide pyrophosphohydrolase domain-containing protein [Leptotrichia wadei]|uniref:MazG nucleotide pyrophosphohydrolase domain-containing protein n=1 Tax=Leptotrichia wadei TaxID=157687 RepID=UPI0028D2EE05|nr:MazG nucleotide pyrophosphohydrolase domain-containing protein [Leptotrichia wadei]
MKRNAEDMTLKEVQYLIKRIEKGTLDESRDKENLQQKRENGQRLVLKLIEEFGELAENIRKNVRFDGENIKGTIEEEVFDVFYYVIAIANDYGIDLEKIFYIKDELNKVKYGREFSIYEARGKWKNMMENKKNKKEEGK